MAWGLELARLHTFEKNFQKASDPIGPDRRST